jgi:hypothetical protein
MKRFTFKKKLATMLALLSIMTVAAIPMVAADQSQQTSEGQIGGGNIYFIKNETQNTAYGATTNANACDELRYKVYLYNPGPSFLSSVNIQATLSSRVATSNTSTVTTNSVNAFPTTTSASATVNLSSAQSVSYESGTTQLLDINNNLIKDLPDGITQGGINIGDLAASGTEFVQFDAKVNCPPPPTPPQPPKPPKPTPTYACTVLGLAADVNRTVKISTFAATQTNGAVFKDAVIDWGDNSTPLTTNNVVGQTHQYTADGTYTVTATAHFTANGQDVTAGGPQCQQKVTFSSTTPPAVTPPTVTPAATPAAPTALVNTGPGSVIGLFGAATAIATFGYRWMLSRRLSRQ